MDADEEKAAALFRPLRTLALANGLVWALSIIALIVVLEKSSSPKGMFVLLAGGLALGVGLLSAVTKAQHALGSYRE